MADVPIIAIVDDDVSVRRSLLRVVESAGYKAETFASAREFLTWLPHGRAACLVLDVHMDELSGFDLYDRLNVPVVFITGRDDVVTVARIERSRAAGHLRKPFDRAAVLDAIHRAVGAPQARPPGGPGGVDGHPSREEDGHGAGDRDGRSEPPAGQAGPAGVAPRGTRWSGDAGTTGDGGA